MFDLTGKNALVCGSTHGIGKACAIALAQRGVTVTLLARNLDLLTCVCAELPTDHGQTHNFIQADFNDYEQVRERAELHLKENNPIHILINNTGGPPAGPALQADPAAFADGFALHLLCNQVLVQAVTPGMKEANFGRIINIISTSVISPIKGLGVSNAIRGAVANWARTLAAELGPYNITVNNLLPGFVATERLNSLIQKWATNAGKTTDTIEREKKQTIPAGRFADPSEIAAAAAFLSSPAASYINGVNLPVDGGRLATQ